MSNVKQKNKQLTDDFWTRKKKRKEKCVCVCVSTKKILYKTKREEEKKNEMITN